LRRVGFWVYSALMYSVFALAFSYIISTNFWNPYAALVFPSVLFIEFCVVLVLSWFTLKHVVEFKARGVILATSIIGWFPATLIWTWMLGLFYPRPSYDMTPYYNFYMFFTMGVYFSLLHSVVFCVGALIGALVPVSYAERLKRKILFTVSKSEGVVDLLKLAVSLEDDLLSVKDGVMRLIREGYIVGYLDNASNKLHVSLTRSLTPTPEPSAVQSSEGLVREYNIFKSLLTDLEELRKQNRISPSSYNELREEYERRLKLLESAMRQSTV